ncbi:MAG: hypothetical protein JSS14_04625 [Proteobacteria bacterium]|nr:hypothetical protein [Pseudomonadota bacterium]
MAKVWEDLNANGIQDAGERGIAGATVTLFTDRNGDGQISANEVSEVGVTDATGEYIFTRNSGTLGQMTFTLPPGYDAASPRHVGANKSVDSDGPTTDLFRFGQSDPIASGFFKFAKLGDRVWNDTNADGIQDPGETGRAGVTVELYQATVDGEPGALVGTQTTDANGNYLFTQLTPGDYIVKFVAPDGTYISPPYVGIDNSINSDAEETSGRTAVYTLTSGQEELAVDMGLYVTTSVKDEVSLCEDRSATFNVLTNDIGMR